MTFCERLFVNLILVFCCICSTALGQINEDLYTSDLQCFGAGSQLNVICPVSSSIAIQEIIAGMRPASQGCNETAGNGTDCCDTAEDNCEFPFPSTNNVLYHDQCSGNHACMPGVERVDIAHAPGACNESLYPRYSQYMFLSYFCVEDSRTGNMSISQLSVVNDALYLHSPGYPGSSISSSVTELSCSVETDDCSAVLNVYVIERNLADYINSTFCHNQSLSIIEPDGTALVQWTCSDNTYDISQQTQSTDNYITVNLINTMTTDSGQFWIGFDANTVANLAIDCPAKERQHCLPNTTTSTTSTTTPVITTPIAAFNETEGIKVTPSTPGQDTIMIIGVCLGGVFLITFIIGLFICWKHKKKKKEPPEMKKLIDSEEPQNDNQTVRSSSNLTGTCSTLAIAKYPGTEQHTVEISEDNDDADADERQTDVSHHSDQIDKEMFEVNELLNDDNEQVLDVSIVIENEEFSVNGMIQVTPCVDAESGPATSLSGNIEELQPMNTDEFVLTIETPIQTVMAPYQRLYLAICRGFYGIPGRKKKKRRRKRNSIKPIVKETSSP